MNDLDFLKLPEYPCQFDPTRHLDIDPLCGNCYEVISEPKKCGRCASEYYCSQDCQKEHYPEHKEFCLEYKRLHNAMKKEEKTLHEEGYFSPDNIGHFWGLIDPRDYCRARYALAGHILHKAHYDETKFLYEKGLSHLMELTRLCWSDNMGVRFEIAFILIKLNRDEDAYNFIKWWMTIDPDWSQPPQNTQPGDWVYLENQDIEEDLLQITRRDYINLHWLAALTLIKMRILCKYNLLKLQMNSVENTITGWNNDDNQFVYDIIQEYLVGHDHLDIDEMIATQTKYIHSYLDQMINDNEVFVKALVNPGPLRKQAYPQYSSRGTNQEAYLVINKCCRAFARVNGILKLLETKVGENPTYDATMRNDFY